MAVEPKPLPPLPPPPPGAGFSPTAIAIAAAAGVVVIVIAAIFLLSGGGDPPVSQGSEGQGSESQGSEGQGDGGSGTETTSEGSLAGEIPSQAGPFVFVDGVPAPDIARDLGAIEGIDARYEGQGVQVDVLFLAFDSAEAAEQDVAQTAGSLIEDGWNLSDPFDVTTEGGEILGRGGIAEGEGAQAVFWSNGHLSIFAIGPPDSALAFYEASPV